MNMTNMFQGCISLKKLILPNITDMNNIFFGILIINRIKSFKF